MSNSLNLDFDWYQLEKKNDEFGDILIGKDKTGVYTVRIGRCSSKQCDENLMIVFYKDDHGDKHLKDVRRLTIEELQWFKKMVSPSLVLQGRLL